MKSWLISVLSCIACGLAPAAPTDLEAQSKALERAANAVVGVQTLAVPDARSNNTLGRVRQGSGVVISSDGLVLTIGYLILEADQVQLVLGNGRNLPARVVGYDLATGFGLLQPLAPIAIAPAPLGTSRDVTPEDGLLVVSGEPSGQLSAARMVSRRVFAGYWEYRIDDALFTSPPRTDHSGAAAR
jgi:serine protease Do